MNVRQRLITAQLLPLLPVVIIGLVTIAGLARMTRGIDQMRAEEIAAMRSVVAALDLVAEEDSLLAQAHQTGDPGLRARAVERSLRLRQVLTRVDDREAPIGPPLEHFETVAGLRGPRDGPAAQIAAQELSAVLRVHQDRLSYTHEVALAAMGRTGLAIAVGIGSSVLLLLVGGLSLAWLAGRSLVEELDGLETGTRALAQGDFDHRIEIHVDDEFGRLARAFNRMAEQISQLDRMKVDFFANVSHDLKTPLTSLLEATDLLSEEIAGPLTGPQRELVGVLGESGRRLRALVGNVLDLSRIGALQGARTTGELIGIIDAVLTETALLARRRNITVERRGVDGPVEILVNRGMLEQVLMNLIDNAIKFSPQGEVVTVTVAVTRAVTRAPAAGETATVRVRDRGPGIPPAHRDRVFDRFYQVPSERTHSGSGLGLHICRSIIDTHGGRIGVDHPEDGGAELWFTLPISS